jgi:uncharacterized protein HemX
MSGAATIVSVVGAVVGAAVSYAGQQRAASASKKAAAEQRSNAEKLYAQQDQENNRRNARGPNTDALFAQNQLEGQQGETGTMLTGPSGVDPSSLSLGKNTLIGGA